MKNRSRQENPVPTLQECVRRNLFQILAEQMPAIAKELARQGQAGDVPAAKLALEMYKSCQIPPPRRRR